MFPIELMTVNSVFAVTHKICNVSHWFVETKVPPDEVAMLPKLQTWPAFICITQPETPFPAIPNTVPSGTVAGIVTVVNAVFETIYPLLATAV